MDKQFVWVWMKAYGIPAEVGMYGKQVPFDMIERDLEAHVRSEFGVVRLYEIHNDGSLNLVRAFGEL